MRSYHACVLTTQAVIAILNNMAINGDPVPGASASNKNLISRRNFLKWGAALAGMTVLGPPILDRATGKAPPKLKNFGEALAAATGTQEAQTHAEFPTTKEDVEALFRSERLADSKATVELTGPTLLLKNKAHELLLTFLPPPDTQSQTDVIQQPIPTDNDFIVILPKPGDHVSITIDAGTTTEAATIQVLELSAYMDKDGNIPREQLSTGMGEFLAASSGLWSQVGEIGVPTTRNAQRIQSHPPDNQLSPPGAQIDTHADPTTIADTLRDTVFAHNAFS